MRRVTTESEKFSVRATVRRADERKRMFENRRQSFVIVVDEILHRKLRLEVLLDRQIKQRIDRVLALVFGNLGDGTPLEWLVLCQMHIIDKRRIPTEHANGTLLSVRASTWHHRRSFFHVALQ